MPSANDGSLRTAGSSNARLAVATAFSNSPASAYAAPKVSRNCGNSFPPGASPLHPVSPPLPRCARNCPDTSPTATPDSHSPPDAPNAVPAPSHIPPSPPHIGAPPPTPDHTVNAPAPSSVPVPIVQPVLLVGFVQLALDRQYIGQIAMSVSVVGLQPNGFPILFNRLVQPPKFCPRPRLDGNALPHIPVSTE